MMTQTTTNGQAAYTNGIKAAWRGLGDAIEALDVLDEDSRVFTLGQIDAFATCLVVLTGRPRDQIVAAGFKRAERQRNAA